MSWEDFKQEYRKYCQVKAKELPRKIAKQSWDMDESFINLALLLKEDKAKLEEEKDDDIKFHDNRGNAVEKVYESNKKLAFKDLFATKVS